MTFYRYNNFIKLLLLLLFCRVAVLAAQPVDELSVTNKIANGEGNGRTSEEEIAINFSAAQPSSPATVTSDGLRVLFFLLLLLLIIYLLLRFLRRLDYGSASGGSLLQIIASKPLSGSSLLHLIDVDDKIYLVVVQGQHATLLDAIADQEKCDRLRLLAGEQVQVKKFSWLLRHFHGSR